jgi:hypothetical protein
MSGSTSVLPRRSCVAFVLGMHGHAEVAEHRLGPRGRDRDEAIRLALHRVLDVPELVLALHLLDLVVGERGLAARSPVDDALAAVDQAFSIELHEVDAHRAREPSSSVKRVRDQSHELPMRRNCSTGCGRRTLPSRPTRARGTLRARAPDASFLPSVFRASSRRRFASRCRRGRCPAATERPNPALALEADQMSWIVLLSACPMCSAPVTFGGGITIVYGTLRFHVGRHGGPHENAGSYQRPSGARRPARSGPDEPEDERSRPQ